MARERTQIDLGGPLLREREGCKLSERSLSSRLCEIIERLGRVTEAAMPDLTSDEWSLVCWSGWSSLQRRARQRDVDSMTWMQIVADAAETEQFPHLSQRLREMGPVQRIAVLERVEAYGRSEAMR
jgi:hypothetical protein